MDRLFDSTPWLTFVILIAHLRIHIVVTRVTDDHNARSCPCLDTVLDGIICSLLLSRSRFCVELNNVYIIFQEIIWRVSMPE